VFCAPYSVFSKNFFVPCFSSEEITEENTVRCYFLNPEAKTLETSSSPSFTSSSPSALITGFFVKAWMIPRVRV